MSGQPEQAESNQAGGNNIARSASKTSLVSVTSLASQASSVAEGGSEHDPEGRVTDVDRPGPDGSATAEGVLSYEDGHKNADNAPETSETNNEKTENVVGVTAESNNDSVTIVGDSGKADVGKMSVRVIEATGLTSAKIQGKQRGKSYRTAG